MKLDIKELIAKLTNTPMIIEQGTDGDWTYRKWADGRLECERARNVGTYTFGTQIVTGIRAGGNITTSIPSMVATGTLEVVLVGNSSNSACWLEKISEATWRVAKAATSNVTVSNLTVIERIINGTWQ